MSSRRPVSPRRRPGGQEPDSAHSDARRTTPAPPSHTTGPSSEPREARGSAGRGRTAERRPWTSRRSGETSAARTSRAATSQAAASRSAGTRTETTAGAAGSAGRSGGGGGATTSGLRDLPRVPVTLTYSKGGREGGALRAARPTMSLRWVGLMIVMVVALAVLVPTVRHFVEQREELRTISAQVEDARQRTQDLERQQRLWADPDYVRAQARDRLGYVVPGERTFVVVDPQTVTGDQRETAEDRAAAAARARAANAPWYVNVWESLDMAGHAPASDGAEPGQTPAPVESTIAPPPSVTEETTP